MGCKVPGLGKGLSGLRKGYEKGHCSGLQYVHIKHKTAIDAVAADCQAFKLREGSPSEVGMS